MTLKAEFLQNEDGATATEFALVFPAFIVLMLGVVGLAWSQHCISSMHYALENASRSVMLNPEMSEAQVSEQVREQLDGMAEPNVTVTLAITDDNNGRVAHVSGRYEHVIPVPLLENYPIVYVSTVSTALPKV